jgi:hypothetical protein
MEVSEQGREYSELGEKSKVPPFLKKRIKNLLVVVSVQKSTREMCLTAQLFA